MRNELQIFKNTEFGEMRTVEENGKVLFCGSDIAKALGYARPNDAISAHCRYTVKRSIPHPQSENKCIEMSFIPEGDVYRLISHSKLPGADRFESWIFDEVLPTIRKTGSYSILTKPDSYMIDDPVERAKRWIEEYEEKKTLETKIEEQKPLVDFATQVSDTTGLVDVGAFAKLCRKKGLDIGRNKLFTWLRERKYLRDNNEPYQSYINSGYFVVKEYTYLKNGEPQIGQKTYLTGKGQQYIYNKLAEV